MNLRNFKERVLDYVAGVRGVIHEGKKIGLVLLVTNAVSFSTVAMEKGISGYSSEQAAFINSLHAVPILYDIGFEAGHRVFYGEKDFLGTKERTTGFKNLIPRPYLNN